MKIYTRTGDDGTTGLLGTGRVRKHDTRVEAYGSVDELNAALGVAGAHDDEGWFRDLLAEVQSALFQVGAELATTDSSMLEKLSRVADDSIAGLERHIDLLEQDLAPLTRFILPSGTKLAAQFHLARTVCRRAERRMVALEPPIDPVLLRYVNRLSDLLFVLARVANHRGGIPETEWL